MVISPAHGSLEHGFTGPDNKEVTPSEQLRHLLTKIRSQEENWILDKQAFLSLHKVGLNDGLPVVRSNLPRSDVDQRRQRLWTKAFANPENLELFFQLLQMNLSIVAHLHLFEEKDFQFVVFMGTLLIEFNKDHPGQIDTRSLEQVKKLLGFFQKQVNYTFTKAGYKRPWKQRLFSTVEGENDNFEYADLIAGEEGSKILTAIEDMRAHLPQNLSQVGPASLHPKPIRRIMAREQLNVDPSLLTPEQKEAGFREAWVRTKQAKDEQQSANFLTEHDERNLLRRQFTDLTLRIRNRAQEVGVQGHITLFLRTQNESEVNVLTELLPPEKQGRYDIIEIEPNDTLIMSEQLAPLFAGVTIDDWRITRSTLEVLLHILRQAQIRISDVNKTGRDPQYQGRNVKINTPKLEELSENLKTFIKEYPEKHISQKKLKREKLLYKRPWVKEVGYKPNYPVLAAATLVSVMGLYFALEAGNPNFGWGKDIRLAYEEIKKSIEITATQLIDSLSHVGVGKYDALIAKLNESSGWLAEDPANSKIDQERMKNQLPAIQYRDYFNGKPEVVTNLPDFQVFYTTSTATPYAVDFNRETVVNNEGSGISEISVQGKWQTTKSDFAQRGWSEQRDPLEVMSPYLKDFFSITPEFIQAHEADFQDISSVLINLRNIPPAGLMIPLDRFETQKVNVLSASSSVVFSDSVGDPSRIDPFLFEFIDRDYKPTIVVTNADRRFVYFPPIKIPELETLPKYQDIVDKADLYITLDILRLTPSVLSETHGAGANWKNAGIITHTVAGQTFIDKSGHADSDARGVVAFYPDGVKLIRTPDTEAFFSEEGHVISPEVISFLKQQGFDFDKIMEAGYGGQSGSADIDAHSQDRMYQEIFRQMKAKGFQYSTDESVNKYLTHLDMRSYVVMGETVGLDCDGLSFVGNLIYRSAIQDFLFNVRNLSPEDIVQMILKDPPYSANGKLGLLFQYAGAGKTIAVDLDTNGDGFEGGTITHAMIPIQDTESMRMVEATEGFDVNDQATVDQIQQLIEEYKKLQITIPDNVAGAERLILFFAAAITSLTGILVSRKIIEMVKKERKKKKQTPTLSHRVKQITHIMEKRLVPRIFPSFEGLTPVQLAKVPEVALVLFGGIIPDPDREGAENRVSRDNPQAYKQVYVEKVLQTLESLELPAHIAPEQQIRAATSLNKMVHTIIASRTDRPYRRIVSSAIDQALQSEAISSEMKQVILAVRALMM
jgi:hypothetical protein